MAGRPDRRHGEGRILYDPIDVRLLATMGKETAGELATAREALATEKTLSLQMTNVLQSEDARCALHTAPTAIGKRLET